MSGSVPARTRKRWSGYSIADARRDLIDLTLEAEVQVHLGHARRRMSGGNPRNG
jgi:hypothetical protein